jgi:hypothetical protein
MYWLGFYDWSFSNPGMHSTEFIESQNDTMCEATHYCYSPHFWNPVWEELARVLQLAISHGRLNKLNRN